MEQNDEEEALHRRVDCVCIASARVGDGGLRDRSEAWDFGADVLPLDEEVCWTWCRRAASPETT